VLDSIEDVMMECNTATISLLWSRLMQSRPDSSGPRPCLSSVQHMTTKVTFFFEIVHSIVLDTGETFGIIPSEETRSHVLQNENFDLILLGDEGASADASDDEVISNSDIETGSKQRHKSGKGNAAAWLATMEGTKTMAKKVAGEHEKNKFWEECTTYDS
jgi:hypothetical protein